MTTPPPGHTPPTATTPCPATRGAPRTADARFVNLGILAHVDAGKTSLTERLLHTAGVIDEIGSVDAGSTQTDTLALERQRGITIRSAVVSFVVDDVTVNLIDTPGHPDFIAEVERVLGVLDGAVLVVSAVEGVQAQTRVLMRTLRRLAIPTLIFVNKIDRSGADPGRVLDQITRTLCPTAVPMGTVRGPGSLDATYAPYALRPSVDPRLVEAVAEHDDEVLAAWIAEETGRAGVTSDHLWRVVEQRTAAGTIHPVLFGSAATGAGAKDVLAGIRRLLPGSRGSADGPLSGTVFKIERGPAGEKIAYVRLFSGTVGVRDTVTLGGHEDKITALGVFDRGQVVERAVLTAGEIGQVRGLGHARIGDVLGDARGPDDEGFAPPTLETVVTPVHDSDRGALHVALSQLAEQDPLIDVRQDPVRQEVSVSLYGEVQKEVIEATLVDDFGVAVGFSETTTICTERVVGTGEAAEVISVAPNPFLATVGLRVEPAPLGAGVSLRLEIELGSMPSAFFAAVEEAVRATLTQGLHGWAIADCVVTMTRSGYYARQSHAHGTFDKSMSSTAGDFRYLTPLVLVAALRQAGTVVLEPIHRFRMEIGVDTLSAVLPALARRRAVPFAPQLHGSSYVLEGDVPADQVHLLTRLLPGLTHGEGVIESAFDRYEPVTGQVPSRSRTDANPLDRREYLAHAVRSGAGRRP